MAPYRRGCRSDSTFCSVAFVAHYNAEAVLRVARTLADLDGSPAVRRLHVAEALSYRRIALSW
ncbi:MAG TPA: hypothetical protein VJN67_05790 [Stellaceae bacterium]|nr:hypothetical protein [Stellaceae bacterium]